MPSKSAMITIASRASYDTSGTHQRTIPFNKVPKHWKGSHKSEDATVAHIQQVLTSPHKVLGVIA